MVHDIPWHPFVNHPTNRNYDVSVEKFGWWYALLPVYTISVVQHNPLPLECTSRADHDVMVMFMKMYTKKTIKTTLVFASAPTFFSVSATK